MMVLQCPGGFLGWHHRQDHHVTAGDTLGPVALNDSAASADNLCVPVNNSQWSMKHQLVSWTSPWTPGESECCLIQIANSHWKSNITMSVAHTSAADLKGESHSDEVPLSLIQRVLHKTTAPCKIQSLINMQLDFPAGLCYLTTTIMQQTTDD